VEESIFKFRARLTELASFFTRENAENFNALFTHELNSIFCRVEFTTLRAVSRALGSGAVTATTSFAGLGLTN
jgi:hypothetical protein